MQHHTSQQIFYDANHHRWVFYKWGMLFFIIPVLILIGMFGDTILRSHRLPQLMLSDPEPVVRSTAPTNPSTSDPGMFRKNSSFSTGSFASSNTIVPSPAIGKYRPKIIAFFVNWDDTSMTSLKTNINSIDQFVPEWLHLKDEQGSIDLDDEQRQQDTTRMIQSMRPGLAITPLVNNYDSQKEEWDQPTLEKMLQDPAARQRNIQQLLNYVLARHYAGINIDYENVPDLAQPLLVQYMVELKESFAPYGLIVTMDVPLEDASFDLKALGSAVDQLVLMAYDEHWDESVPGPVSSQSWFVQNMQVRLAELPAEKYIIAVGNYGYDWIANEQKGSVVTFQDALLTAKDAGVDVSFDQQSLNPFYSYVDAENKTHSVWYLDAVTTLNQRSFLKRTPVYGYALWRLGSEDPSVWQTLAAESVNDPELLSGMQTVRYGYDIDYQGTGEILRVKQVPAEGSRLITFDQTTELVTKEQYVRYPSPYVIDRWGGSKKKNIALTFDDGPDSEYTARILDILRQQNATATFFVVGTNATRHPDLIRRMQQEGHEIGSHTFTHPNISTISDATFALELNALDGYLAGIIGRHTLLFRPPYAEDIEPVTPDQVRPLAVANDLGYYTVGMHIDPNDWSQPGAKEIVRSVLEQADAGAGNIVLLHDSGGDRSQTIIALPVMIKLLRARGYEIVSVSDIMGVSREDVMPVVQPDQKLFAWINQASFSMIDGALSILAFLFYVGIFLGTLRLVMVCILAINQRWPGRSRRKRNIHHPYIPRVSVIIPAFNEQRVIARTVSAILRSSYQSFEVIIVDDGSTDRTLGVVRDHFGMNPRVRVFGIPNGGKAAALNYGIRQSDADIVITLDADTLFETETIGHLVHRFSDPRVGAVAGNAKVGNRVNVLTYWQALEYVTSQNLDRRAFDVMNGITVVPGSVGAWKRTAVVSAGGFSDRTLAEDADLTFSLLRKGYKVVYEDKAIGYTEAPDTVRGFIRQRFRWMYGTLQTAWYHKDTMFRPRYRALGFISIPNIFLYQLFFPLISPIMDASILISFIWTIWQSLHHPFAYYSTLAEFQRLFFFYLVFLGIELATSIIAFALEHKEDWRLLQWVFFQRFFYRQLMYYVAIKVFVAALQGRMVRWGSVERKATVPSRSVTHAT